MKRKVIFARMLEKDILNVVAIERLVNPSPWSESSFRSELANPQAHYWVAQIGEALVGFAGFWLVIDEAHITNIAVHPDYQGQGIGKSLMSKLIEDAASKGAVCATLEVRKSNEKAIRLYESLGFVQSAIRKAYYPHNREDAIVMWLMNIDSNKLEKSKA